MIDDRIRGYDPPRSRLGNKRRPRFDVPWGLIYPAAAAAGSVGLVALGMYMLVDDDLDGSPALVGAIMGLAIVAIVGAIGGLLAVAAVHLVLVPLIRFGRWIIHTLVPVGPRH